MVEGKLMRLSLWSLAIIFATSLFSSASAQSDPRFAEAIEAAENWDQEKAKSLLTAACDEKIAGACGRLLGMHIEDFEENQQRGLSSRLCDTGDRYACYLHGNMANWGSGGAEDKGKARAAYAASCEAGLPIACTAHAKMIAQGEGGAKNAARALAINEDGCRKKYAPACFAAADALQSTIWNGEREASESAKMEAQLRDLYEKACDNSHAEACLSLAKMLREGEGGDKDPVRAMRLMEDTCHTEIRACEQVIRLRFYQP
jgi:TPR repeat protein